MSTTRRDKGQLPLGRGGVMSGANEVLTPDFSKLFNRNCLLAPGHLGTFIIPKEVKFCTP